MRYYFNKSAKDICKKETVEGVCNITPSKLVKLLVADVDYGETIDITVDAVRKFVRFTTSDLGAGTVDCTIVVGDKLKNNIHVNYDDNTNILSIF